MGETNLIGVRYMHLPLTDSLTKSSIDQSITFPTRRLRSKKWFLIHSWSHFGSLVDEFPEFECTIKSPCSRHLKNLWPDPNTEFSCRRLISSEDCLCPSKWHDLQLCWQQLTIVPSSERGWTRNICHVAESGSRLDLHVWWSTAAKFSNTVNTFPWSDKR